MSFRHSTSAKLSGYEPDSKNNIIQTVLAQVYCGSSSIRLQLNIMTSLNQRLAEAVDLFVMTKFDQCFQTCSSVIQLAKCEPEEERNWEVIEAATALGIQALAETDMWHHVVGFITDVYGTVDLCPPRIIQVCILLHAHVKEYLPSHKLVQIWLRNPHNLNQKQCAQVIRVYAQHILCPTGSYETLKEVVQSCKSLTETERLALLQLPQAERYEDAKQQSGEPDGNLSETLAHNKHISGLGTDHTGVQESEVTSSCQREAGDERFLCHTGRGSSPENVAENEHSDRSTLKMFCRGLHSLVTVVMSYLRHQAFLVGLTGLLAFWGLVHTQTGDPLSSLGRLVVLWRVFLQKLHLLLH